jgi:cytochrome c
MRRGKFVGIILALGALVPPGMTAAQAGNAVSGAELFKPCAACHSTDAGVSKQGPGLRGVVGRKAGSVAGFAYSPAMKAFDKVWDAALLDSYLYDPAGTMPGTKMAYPGLKDENDRADVIAYLATLK